MAYDRAHMERGAISDGPDASNFVRRENSGSCFRTHDSAGQEPVTELDAQVIKGLPREIASSAVPLGSRGPTWKSR
jgi:hypothetical protein